MIARPSVVSRAVSCASLVLLFSAAGCGNSNSPTASVATPLATTDANFVIGAGESSNAEIGAAQMAVTKSSNPDVLAFAKQMITDHTQENNELMFDTKNDSPTAPPAGTLNPVQAAEAQKLSTLTGTAFDQEYVNSEVMGHMLNLNNNYTPEVSSGTNATVKGYANKFISQIQMHLTMIQAIKTQYGF